MEEEVVENTKVNLFRIEVSTMSNGEVFILNVLPRVHSHLMAAISLPRDISHDNPQLMSWANLFADYLSELHAVNAPGL